MWLRGLCLLLFFQTAVFSLDADLESFLQTQHVPGLSVALITSGNIIRMQGVGKASLDPPKFAAYDTVYDIGTVTQWITAVGVLQLVDAKKIELDGKIGQYLTTVPDAWLGVTIRHLLSHTSGLPDYRDEPRFSPHQAVLQKTLIQSVAKKPVKQPGKEWKLSATNYVLLAQLIEKISGKLYTDYLQESVIQKAGLSHTFFPSSAHGIKSRAKGYAGDMAMPLEVSPNQQTALNVFAGLESTAEDLAIWTQAFFSEGLLSNEMRDAFLQPVQLNAKDSFPVGMAGMRVFKDHSIQVMGAVPGYTTVVRYFPLLRSGIMMIANRQDVDFSGLLDTQ